MTGSGHEERLRIYYYHYYHFQSLHSMRHRIEASWLSTIESACFQFNSIQERMAQLRLGEARVLEDKNIVSIGGTGGWGVGVQRK